MKTLCAILLILSLVSANYIPDWTNESDSTDLWQPTSLSLSREPKDGQSSVIKACGIVQDQFIVGDFYIEVKTGELVIFASTITLNNEVVLPGDNYCFKHDAFMTWFGEGSFTVNIELRDKNDARIGAVSFGIALQSDGF